MHFAVFFGVVLDAVAASVAVKLLLRPFFFVKCSSAFHTKRTKMPRKIPTCAHASGWGVSCCMVEWVTASASRAYHALFAYVQAERIWCHLAIISIRHSFAGVFGVERGRKIHSFTLAEVLLVLDAQTASVGGGGGGCGDCCWGCSCCCGGCSVDDGSGSVSTGVSVVSCVSKTRS